MRGQLLPPRVRPRHGLALLALSLAMFGLLAADLIRQGPVTGADLGISTWFHGRMHPLATQVLLLVTHVHGTTGILLMASIAAGLLAWMKQVEWAVAAVICVPGGLLLNVAVKHLFERARPSFDNPVLALSTYSFPSGHTAGATVWWGFLLMLVCAFEQRAAQRAAAFAVAALFILATALSRVYLGVHYPSDVLAGIAEGVAWLAACFTAFGLARPSGRAPAA